MMKLFEEMVEGLSNDPHRAIEECLVFFRENLDETNEFTEKDKNLIFFTYSTIEKIIEFGKIGFINSFESNGYREDYLNHFDFIEFCEKEIEISNKLNEKDRITNLIKIKYSNSFSITFTENDLKRSQILINELRDIISNIKNLTDEHRRRLILKLESLQAELHKEVSDVDRIFGLAAEAGVLMRKLGNDAKPAVDRIRELMQIGWRSKAEAEGLPSGDDLPMLGSPEQAESDSE